MLASKSGTLFRCACFCVLLTTSATKAGMAAPASDTPTAITTHMGGTLRLVAASSGGTLDPQINYSAKYINLFANVYDGLTTFRKADGLAGADVVPDLAEDLPQPEDGGLTYTFRLREGITFSNGQPVATADVVASFRRIFRVGSPTAGAFYGAIKGADACLRSPADCKLEGVVENPATRSITFHLTTPDTEFLHKLAFTHAVILPANAPDHDTGNVPLPSTGPYQLTAYDPNRFLKLERNPYFKEWNAQAQPFGYPDRIDYTFGIPDEAAVTAVENGQYDWMADPIPLDRLGELGSRFASQTHVLRHPAMYFLPMNMREAPFSSLKARQAVNYALNRKAITILYGGPAIARPLCGMLPSTLPASSTQCFYTKDASPESPAPMWRGTDMEKARNLVRESGTYGQKVTVIAANTSVDLAMGAWVRDMLQNLGYRANLRPLSSALAFSYMQNSDNHVQIGVASWSADYPSASNFLDALLGCENIHPGSDSSINIPGFCNQDVQSLMDKAKTDVSLSAQAQNALWQEADRRVMEQAPVAPAIEKDAVILTSPRLKNLLFTTVNQLLFSQAWVQ